MNNPIKKAFVVSLLLFFCLVAHGQYVRDVVYLKNGAIAVGKADDSRPAGLQIENLKGEVQFYNFEEIDSIERNVFDRYAHYISAGMLVGSGNNSKETILSILSEHNFLLSQHFSIGFLTGIEVFNESVIPLGLNLKYYIPLTSRSLFFSFSGGKSFSLDEPESMRFLEDVKTKGGAFWGLDFGFTVPLNYKNSLFLAMGYRNQTLKYSYQNWGLGSVKREHIYDRFSMRFGLALH